MNQAVLEVKNIHKTFGEGSVVKGVDFDIQKGEIDALFRDIGAGKSTLIKILGGIYKKDSGQIYVKDQLAEINNISDARTYGISIIHQELSLFPNLIVYQNIFMAREQTVGKIRLDNKTHIEKTKNILKRLEHEIDPETLVGELRVGQQQMIEIARNLVADDLKVLIMDEPTSSLSQQEVQVLFKIMRELTAQGISIVYISHRLEEIMQIGDHVTILRDGKYVSDADVKDIVVPWIVHEMTGGAKAYPKRETKVDWSKVENVLEVKNLCLPKAGGGYLVDHVSFDLKKGEILGIYGLMGAGRTETTRAIFGVDPKDSGEFYVDGKKIEVNCPMDAIRNGVVLAPEDRKKDGLCTKLSIRQNLALPNLDLVCNKMGVINSGKEDALCEKAVKDLQIKTPNVEIDSGNLSGGNQQKVVVGKWLARDSRVVIFDEPTRGIDVGAKVEIYNLMNELKKQGIAVMFVSSEMPEVMGIADRIIVMCDGRITGEVSAREATQDEILTMATSFENKSIKETEGGSKNE